MQGYNGLPIAGSEVFGDAVYTDTAAYVGIVESRWRCWERCVVASTGDCFLRGSRGRDRGDRLPPSARGLVHSPPTRPDHRLAPRSHDTWTVRSRSWAGIGMDALVRVSGQRSTQLLLAAMFAGGFTLLLILWLAGTSGLSRSMPGSEGTASYGP